jgi:hypothetical protein
MTLILIICFLAAVSADGVKFIPATLNDYLPHFQDKKNFNETWSYQIFLNNSIQVHVDLSRVNDGSKKYTTANMFFLNFKKSNQYVTCQYPAKQYFKSHKKNNGIRIAFHKNIYMEGNETIHRVRFFREKKEKKYFLDLEFSDMAPGFALQDKYVKLASGNRTGSIIHFPHARVKGVIAVDRDTIRVKGTGYLEHVYQSDLPTGLFTRGVRFFKTGDGLFSGLVLMGNKKNKYKVIGLGIKREKGSLQVLTAKNISGNTITFSNGETLKWKSFKKQHEWGVLDEVPMGLGGLAGFMKKDLVNIRGTGTAESGDRFVVTKLIVK